MLNKKRGNICIIWLSLFIVIFLIIFFNLFMSYVQITTMIYPIRKNIFYVVQNSYFSANKEDLKYYNYVIDDKELYAKINSLITLNYKGKVKINKLKYDNQTNKVYINYSVYFNPIVFKNILGEQRIIVFEDNIKLKNMEVK